jgi:hypothetical protein
MRLRSNLAFRGAVLLNVPRQGLHSSTPLLKRERKKQDTALRIHLFDFDAVKVDAPTWSCCCVSCRFVSSAEGGAGTFTPGACA